MLRLTQSLQYVLLLMVSLKKHWLFFRIDNLTYISTNFLLFNDFFIFKTINRVNFIILRPTVSRILDKRK